MKKVIVLFLSGLLLTTSCEENFLDVNTDPSFAQSATIDLVFPAGVASGAFVLGGQWQILGSIWAQHWTQSTGANQYAFIDNYNINENDFNRQYAAMYAESLNDLNFVSKKAEEDEEWRYFLMAETMQVYLWQILADLFDDIPYSEALQGSANFTPKFDEGETVYASLISRLDNALSKDLSGAFMNPSNDDVVFSGDMNKWRAFANTLKLKILMRQSEVNAAFAQTEITKLFASGAQFLEVDAQFDEFVNVQNFRNPYYAVQVSSDGNGRGNVDVAASNTLMNFLKVNDDSRLTKLFSLPAGGGTNYVGLTQGDFTNSTYPNSRSLSTPAIGPVHPVVFISAAESKFLQAEAVVRYGVAGSAKTLYEEGVIASFAKLGAAGAQDLLADGGAYAYDDSNALEQILLQKWIATANFNSLEGYFEQLRTGVPDFFTPGVNNVTGGVLPKRLPYPATEVNNNRAALNEIGGQRLVTERIWWDVN